VVAAAAVAVVYKSTVCRCTDVCAFVQVYHSLWMLLCFVLKVQQRSIR